MIEITFKDVGQGDSIVLEWTDSVKKFGIIDCNTKDGTNPVIEHLQRHTDYEIEFIVLSHPHEDHYSGMFDLLEFVEKNAVPLKYFIYSDCNSREALLSAVRGTIALKSLVKVYRKINALDRPTQRILISGHPAPLALFDSVKIEFPYPRPNEITRFVRGAYKDETLRKNNPAANLLSIVCKVFTDDWYILFTSDAEGQVFADIHRYSITRYDKGLKFAQVSHHGAESNFFPAFWKQINSDKKAVAVISVGDNDYGHPSSKVISNLADLGFVLKRTDQELPMPAPTASLLDMISTTTPASFKSSDVSFVIDRSGNII